MFTKRTPQDILSIEEYPFRYEREKIRRELILLSLSKIEVFLEAGSRNGWKGQLKDLNEPVLEILRSITSDKNVIVFDDRLLPEEDEDFNIKDFLFSMLSFDYAFGSDLEKTHILFYYEAITKFLSIIEKYGSIEYSAFVKGLLSKKGIFPNHSDWWLLLGDFSLGKFSDSILKSTEDIKVGVDMGNERFNEMEVPLSDFLMANRDFRIKLMERAMKTFTMEKPKSKDYLRKSFDTKKSNQGFAKMFGMNSPTIEDTSDELRRFGQYAFDAYVFDRENGENPTQDFGKLKKEFISVYNEMAKEYSLSTISSV